MKSFFNNYKKKIIPLIVTTILYTSTIASIITIYPTLAKFWTTEYPLYQGGIILFISALFFIVVFLLIKIIVESDERYKNDLLEKLKPQKDEICYHRIEKKFNAVIDNNSIDSNGIGLYTITEQALNDLKKEGIPDAFIEKLESLKNKPFKSRFEFIKKLHEKFSLDEINKYQEDILNCTNEICCLLNESVLYGFKKKFKHTDIEALANVLTPEGVIEDFEARAQTIWIATTKLDKDVKEKYIMAGVEKNLKAKKNYVYFVPYTKDVQKNIEEFTRKYDKYKDQYCFIIFPEEAIPLFEEIAIYNPTDNNEIRRGLALSTVDDRSVGVYVRLSIFQVERYVKKLENLLVNGSKIEELTLILKRSILKSKAPDLIQKKIFEALTDEFRNDNFLTRKRCNRLKEKLELYEDEYGHVKNFLNRLEPLLYRDLESIKRSTISEEEYRIFMQKVKSTKTVDEAIKLIDKHIKPLIIDKSTEEINE